jgi:hypothetical protein
VTDTLGSVATGDTAAGAAGVVFSPAGGLGFNGAALLGAAMIPVGGEATVTESAALVAVTSNRRRWPTSAALGV